jgi:hypothetical protein
MSIAELIAEIEWLRRHQLTVEKLRRRDGGYCDPVLRRWVEKREGCDGR